MEPYFICAICKEEKFMCRSFLTVCCNGKMCPACKEAFQPSPPTELEKLRDLVREWYAEHLNLSQVSEELAFISLRELQESLIAYCSKQGWTTEGENGS